jgi:CRP-like cAMP-binding protein
MTLRTAIDDGRRRCSTEETFRTPRVAAGTVLVDATELHSRFLAGLPQSKLDIVLSVATHRRFPARSILTHQADPAENFFLLTKGRARHFFTTVDGRKQLLLWLAPGDIFGGSSLLRQSSNYLVSTELLEDSTVAVWSRSVIHSLAAQYPILLENALAVASDYLVWYVATHSSLGDRNANERILHVLAGLTSGIGVKTAEGIALRLTNEELANAAHVTPFTASRLLSRWQRAGAIKKSRGVLIVRDPQRLLLPEL